MTPEFPAFPGSIEKLSILNSICKLCLIQAIVNDPLALFRPGKPAWEKARLAGGGALVFAYPFVLLFIKQLSKGLDP